MTVPLSRKISVLFLTCFIMPFTQFQNNPSSNKLLYYQYSWTYRLTQSCSFCSLISLKNSSFFCQTFKNLKLSSKLLYLYSFKPASLKRLVFLISDTPRPKAAWKKKWSFVWRAQKSLEIRRSWRIASKKGRGLTSVTSGII